MPHVAAALAIALLAAIPIAIPAADAAHDDCDGHVACTISHAKCVAKHPWTWLFDCYGVIGPPP